MQSAAALLSIRPVHANRIFVGTKTVELRRTRPGFSAGQLIFVYASAPTMQIVGTFRVGGIAAASPEDMWFAVGSSAEVTQQQFAQYFEGAKTAYAITISNAERLETTISLAEIRHKLPGFHPPQVYRYLTHDEVVKLIPHTSLKAA